MIVCGSGFRIRIRILVSSGGGCGGLGSRVIVFCRTVVVGGAGGAGRVVVSLNVLSFLVTAVGFVELRVAFLILAVSLRICIGLVFSGLLRSGCFGCAVVFSRLGFGNLS